MLFLALTSVTSVLDNVFFVQLCITLGLLVRIRLHQLLAFLDTT